MADSVDDALETMVSNRPQFIRAASEEAAITQSAANPNNVFWVAA
jgi:hypothetical protein